MSNDYFDDEEFDGGVDIVSGDAAGHGIVCVTRKERASDTRGEISWHGAMVVEVQTGFMSAGFP